MRFVIYTLDFTEKYGGIIALHKLCHDINSIGFKAYLRRPSVLFLVKKIVVCCVNFINFQNCRFLDFNELRNQVDWAFASRKVKRNPNWFTPFYTGKLSEDDIVIYPEIVDGNPYGSKNVVRWFLNVPGKLTGRVRYKPTDLCFYYQQIFNDDTYSIYQNQRLFTLSFDRVLFTRRNFGKRQGTCYAIRKGANRIDVDINIDDELIIDELTHTEISRLFNSCEYFVSYDTQTFYNALAAMCGCISVVIPESGVDQEEWQPDEALRYGIAYGFENLDYAKSTAHLIFDVYDQLEKDAIKSVELFVKKCQEVFSIESKKSY